MLDPFAPIWDWLRSVMDNITQAIGMALVWLRDISMSLNPAFWLIQVIVWLAEWLPLPNPTIEGIVTGSLQLILAVSRYISILDYFMYLELWADCFLIVMTIEVTLLTWKLLKFIFKMISIIRLVGLFT